MSDLSGLLTGRNLMYEYPQGILPYDRNGFTWTTTNSTYETPCARKCKNCECRECTSCPCKTCKIERLEARVAELEADRA